MKRLFLQRMGFLFLNLFPLFLIAQETQAPAAPMPHSMEKAAPLSSQSRSVIMMDMKARTGDILKAYDWLKREKPTFRISAHTHTGPILSNIIDITPMPNETLLIFRLSTSQGIKYQVTPAEDILDLFYP